MTPRIWPGALCVVVSCRGYPENIGAIRTAVRRDPECWFPAWEVDPPLPNGHEFIAERCLRAITPPPGTEITDTDVPAEVAWG